MHHGFKYSPECNFLWRTCPGFEFPWEVPRNIRIQFLTIIKSALTFRQRNIWSTHQEISELCYGLYHNTEKPREKRHLEKPTRRWNDNIQMDLNDLDWESVDLDSFEEYRFVRVGFFKPIEVHRCFGGTYCLHFHGEDILLSKQRARSKQQDCWLLA
jgi:hypothetical protein